MTAYITAEKKGTVALNFTPVVSCFEISIANSYIAENEAFTVSTVELISSSKRLNGTYTVTMGASPTITVPDSEGEADRKITFTPNVTVTSGETLKFTVFTCPVAISDLSVKITLANGDTRTKELKDGGDWLSFAAGGKYRINCGTVPDPYNYTVGTDVDELVIDCKGVETSATFKVFSTKNKMGFITASPWKAQYSTFDGVTWSDWADMSEPVDGFSLSQYLGNGNTAGESITATMPGGTTSERTESYDTFSFRSVKGADNNYIDLSRYDTVTDLDLETPLAQESANCYIIRAQGYYKIPLSYGNSIKAGAANASSFTSQGQTAETGFNLIGTSTDPFVNGLGEAIKFDLAHPDDANYTNYKISPTSSYTVAISTQDTIADVIAGLEIESGTISYIKFHVTENITPCNVVLKVTNGTTTIWSYHLWMVPDETALVVKDIYYSGSKAFSMLTANLGQTPPSGVTITSYPERSIKLRFVSKMDGSVFSQVMVTRPEKEISRALSGVVVNPFYQHGRKDPILSPTLAKGNRVKDTSYMGADTYDAGSANTLASSVANPSKFMWEKGSWSLWYTGSSYSYANMWDTAQSGTTNNLNPVKSVYDPSPRGYHVAHLNAFATLYWNSNYSRSGTWSASPGYMGYLYFKTVSGGTETIAFPASGYRSSTSGYISNIGLEGYVWSSSSSGYIRASYLRFTQGNISPTCSDNYYRATGMAVRSVKD